MTPCVFVATCHVVWRDRGWLGEEKGCLLCRFGPPAAGPSKPVLCRTRVFGRAGLFAFQRIPRPVSRLASRNGELGRASGPLKGKAMRGLCFLLDPRCLASHRTDFLITQPKWRCFPRRAAAAGALCANSENQRPDVSEAPPRSQNAPTHPPGSRHAENQDWWGNHAGRALGSKSAGPYRCEKVHARNLIPRARHQFSRCCHASDRLCRSGHLSRIVARGSRARLNEAGARLSSGTSIAGTVAPFEAVQPQEAGVKPREEEPKFRKERRSPRQDAGRQARPADDERRLCGGCIPSLSTLRLLRNPAPLQAP